MLVPTYLVVSESGVQSRYIVLEDAKQALNDINRGNRLIAEVNGQGILNKDPHVINGHNQISGNGFNNKWCNWNCINSLMDVCQEYLDSTSRLLNCIATLVFQLFYTRLVIVL